MMGNSTSIALQYVSSFMISVVRFCLLPLTHLVYPCLNFSYQIIRHSIFIPLQIIFNILVYGILFLPSKPLFYLLGMDEPSKDSLLRLVPHIQFFVINLVHYVMVGLMMGTLVGLVTGINLKMIQFILTIAKSEEETKVKDEKNQTTPYLNDLIAHASPSVSNDSTGKHKVPRRYNSVSDIVSIQDSPRDAKYKGRSIGESSNAVSLGTSSFNYEDDDGYYPLRQRVNYKDTLVHNNPNLNTLRRPFAAGEKNLDTQNSETHEMHNPYKRAKVDTTNEPELVMKGKSEQNKESELKYPIKEEDGESETEHDHSTTKTTNDLFSMTAKDLDVSTLSSHVTVSDPHERKAG